MVKTPMSNTTHLPDVLGYAQARIARLELTSGSSASPCWSSAVYLAWYAITGLPVHYIPPGGPGLSRPGIISESVATDFASRVLLARYTFTPATVKAAHAEVLTTLHPSLTVAFKVQAEREVALVKEAKLSSQVMILGATVTRPAASVVTVTLRGTRMIWVGGHRSPRRSPGGHSNGGSLVASRPGRGASRDKPGHRACVACRWPVTRRRARHTGGVYCMYVVVVLALVLWPHAQALAARTLPANKPIAVRLEASQPTAVALPEPVASVAAVASEHFSADYDGPYLFLLSVDPTLKGRVFVVGQSGTLYTVFFAVATPADDVVHLTATLPQPAVKAPPLTPSTVLRALRTGTALPGQEPSDLRLPPFPDARVVLSQSRAIAYGALVGMVVTLRNTQRDAADPGSAPGRARRGEYGHQPGPQCVALAIAPGDPCHCRRKRRARTRRADPALPGAGKETLSMPLFVNTIVTWSRRRPVLALLGGGVIVWLLYWQLAPRAALPKVAAVKTQGIPGLGTERAVMEATLAKVEKSNEQLRGSLEEQQRALHQLQQTLKHSEQERQAAAVAQEHRFQELQRAQHGGPCADAPHHPRHASSVAALPAQAPKALPVSLPNARSRGETGQSPASSAVRRPPPFRVAPLSEPGGDPLSASGKLCRRAAGDRGLCQQPPAGALPVLFAVTKKFYGPFQLGGPGGRPLATALPIEGCLMLGKAQADLASSRVIVQLDTLSCVMPDGATFERAIRGYATGADGTLGLVGRYETRDSAYLAKTFLTSLLAGAAEAFALAKRTVIVTPFGGTQTTITGNVGETAGFAALAHAAARLSDFYLQQAERLLPVLWVETHAPARLVLLEGLSLEDLPT